VKAAAIFRLRRTLTPLGATLDDAVHSATALDAMTQIRPHPDQDQDQDQDQHHHPHNPITDNPTSKQGKIKGSG
jgi:hypothetical protein